MYVWLYIILSLVVARYCASGAAVAIMVPYKGIYTLSDTSVVCLTYLITALLKSNVEAFQQL